MGSNADNKRANRTFLLLTTDKVKNNPAEVSISTWFSAQSKGLGKPHDDGSAESAVAASNNETSLVGSSVNRNCRLIGPNADTRN